MSRDSTKHPCWKKLLHPLGDQKHPAELLDQGSLSQSLRFNQHKKSGLRTSTPMTGRMCSEIHINSQVLCRKSPKIPIPCPLAENGMAGVTHEATRRNSLLLAGCFSTTVCWNRLWTQQGRQPLSVIVILNVQGLHGMIAASRLYLHSLKVVCVPKMAHCPSALTI